MDVENQFSAILKFNMQFISLLQERTQFWSLWKLIQVKKEWYDITNKQNEDDIKTRLPVIIYFILLFFLENTWKVHSKWVYGKFLEILHEALFWIFIPQFFIEICS